MNRQIIRHKILCLALVVSLILPDVQSQIIESEIPKELRQCAQSNLNRTDHANLVRTSTEDIHVHCLQQYLWRSDNVNWKGINMSTFEKSFINSLIESVFLHGRSRRQVNTVRRTFPPTGFRIRREYRRLSDQERFAFHAAINQLKITGQYDALANLHQGMIVTSAHGGPNFFGWHRIYLALVEEAIRRVNPRLSIPYWDSSMDFDMDNPANSVIWSPPFLGNGDGLVTTGPFANWNTPVGRLTRNVGGSSRLFSKEVISQILTRCRIAEISEPTAQPQFNLELAHGGPHVWVGGQMSGLNTAAHDPVFFMHHAFVDYLWELFRIRQTRFCGVNPSRDYPPAMGEHEATRPMDGFPQYQNIDGYRSYWTRYWYRYERSPTCAIWRPFCGSPYLRCDVSRQRCISVARMEPTPTAAIAGATRLAAAAPAIMAVAEARAEEALVNVGPRFNAPPSESRTQDALFGFASGRFKRQANKSEAAVSDSYAHNQSKNETTIPIVDSTSSATHLSPLQDWQVSPEQSWGMLMEDIVGLNSVAPGPTVFDPPGFPPVEPTTLQGLDSPVTHLHDKLLPPVQNTFFINGKTSESQWVFIPVRVIYQSKASSQYAGYPIRNKGPHTFSNFRFAGSLGENGNSSTICIQEPSGAIQIRLQSTGLNYYGQYAEYTLVDSKMPLTSTIAFLGIKSPADEYSEILLTGYHSCGLMCQPYCSNPDTIPPAFRPCAGSLKIFSNMTSLYGRSYKEAVEKVWKGAQLNDILMSNVRVIIHCSEEDVLPWLVHGI